MKSLEEKTIQTDKIYKGKLLDVRKDRVLLPNKKVGYREWIHHPGAACCLPVLPGNKIILIKQYRYAVKEESIEIPAGKLDLKEVKNLKPAPPLCVAMIAFLFTNVDLQLSVETDNQVIAIVNIGGDPPLYSGAQKIKPLD